MTASRCVAAALLSLCSCATMRHDRAERVAHEFIGAYNKGSIAALTEFFIRNSPADEDPNRAPSRARWVSGFVWQPIREIVVESVSRPSENEVVFLVRSRLTEARYRFFIEVETKKPGVSFGFEMPIPPAVPR